MTQRSHSNGMAWILAMACASAGVGAAWAAGRGGAAAGGGGGGTPGMVVIALEKDEVLPPEMKTSLGTMPGASELPVRKELPDVMTMNDGTKVTMPEQWAKRREEMRKIMEYYAVGLAPPAPTNLKATVVNTQDIGGGKYTYKLIHLTFGPDGKPEACSLDFGLWTPKDSPPVGVVICQDGSPPGGQVLPTMPQGVNQGRNQDVFSKALAPLPATDPVPGAGGRRGAPGAPAGAPGAPPAGGAMRVNEDGLIFAGAPGAPGAGGPGGGAPRGGAGAVGRGGFGGAGAPGGGRGGRGPEGALTNQVMSHGYAYVTYNSSDCAEDTTARFADGSFAFRHSRFFPAYPDYDWGVLRAWAWGASRIIDYLVTDPAIDKTKIAITGVSRNGKSSLIAGAFDERITLVAPVASSGGGTPAFRFSGFEHGGNEGLSEMTRKYPNWFSPHLHEFFNQADKLPFDNHWYLALCAPRATVALEGAQDQNVNKYGMRQSYLAALPAFEFLGAKDALETNWSTRPHGEVQGDWDGLFAMADKFWQKKETTHAFNNFPPEAMTPPAAIQGAAPAAGQ